MSHATSIQQLQVAYVRTARWMVRHYPFPRGCGLLTRILLPLKVAPPEGQIVRTRFGRRMTTHAEELFLPIWLHGLYEPRLTRLYRELVGPGMTVLDVGANVGWYTALFAGWVGPTGAVHAFEPLPRLAAFCRENVALNQTLAQIRVNEFALGSTVGDFTVYTFDGLSDAHASATTLDRDDATPHRCRVTTLDRYLSESGCRHVDFIKCDVEGHELEVFRGGKALLERGEAPPIAFEVNMRCLASRGIDSDDLRQALGAVGYSHFFEVTPVSLQRVTGHIEPRNADYVAVKSKGLSHLETLSRQSP